MKALSIWQPWAWMVLHGGKDVENRSWPTYYRGPLLIHASLHVGKALYEALCCDAAQCSGIPTTRFRAEGLESRGGLVGIVDLVDVVATLENRYFQGPWGWILANPRPIVFTRWRGRQRLFDVPGDLAFWEAKMIG